MPTPQDNQASDTARVASELLLAAIAFERFGSDLTVRIMRRFQMMERDLSAAVIDLDYLSARDRDERRSILNELTDIAGDIIAAAYQDIVTEMTDDLDTVAETSEGSVINALALVLGAAFAIPKLRTVPVERLRQIADETLVEDAHISAWMERQRGDANFRFMRAIMEAESDGLDIGAIVESITGTLSASRRDGIFQQSRRNAESVIMTAVHAVAANVRLDVYERNSGDGGVIVAVEQISTLDSKTSDICISYSGRRWRSPGYEPIGHGLPFKGGTPRHFRCRSIIVPVINLTDPTFDRSYEDWLRSRPEDEQRDALGRSRLNLWREGKITFSNLVDQRGNRLTVAELIKRFSRRQPD